MSSRALSIQWRINLLSGLCLLAVVAVLLAATLYQAHHNAVLLKEQSTRILGEAAKARLEESANAQVLRIERFFQASRLYGEGFAQLILQLQNQAAQRHIGVDKMRQDIILKTRAALDQHPEILGLYVVLEPSATAPDDPFKGREELASNETGRFALYVSQSQPGQLVQTVLTEQNITTNHAPVGSEPENAWYLCPQQTGKTCIVEPYAVEVEGRSTLMSSISIPLFSDGRFIGVAGIDISLSTLQSLTDALGAALYDGQGQISIRSATGLLAAQSAATTQPQGAGDLLEVIKALHPSADSRPWELRIRMPHQVLQAPALVLQQQLDQASDAATWQSLGLGLLVAVMGLLLIGLTTRSVIRPLLKVADVLDAIVDGNGDLTQRLPIQRRDELGRLSSGFNRFLHTLQPIIGQIQNTALHTRSTADRSALIAEQVNAGMQQQHREVEQAATALHQISASAHEVARNSSEAAAAAVTAQRASQQGLSMFEKTHACINELDTGVASTLGHVTQLANSSAQIGQVLDVICTLAEQTNLLALNAAIEAARAGEQGRGFAVVADEVRRLASNTQNSAGVIREVVDTLQGLTRNVMGSMQSSRDQASRSVELVGETHAALRTISDAVEVIDAMNQQNATAAEQQSAVVEEITRRVSGIRDISESLTGQIEESSRISRSLNQMASQQQQLVAQFRT